MEIKDANDDEHEDLYEKGRKYWENIEPNLNGMLGGFTNVNTIDIDESKKLLRNLLKSINLNDDNKSHSKCLDVGAGIGRVSKYVLSQFFNEIDLLEQNEKFCSKIYDYLGEKQSKLIGNIFNQSIQNFQPINNRYYDCIWGQWVFGYLNDHDFIEFIKKCLKILNKKHGFIVVKDNVLNTKVFNGDDNDQYDDDDDEQYIDEEDGHITRSEQKFLSLFKMIPDLIVKNVYKQRNMPKKLFPVKMFVLVHSSFSF